MGVLWVYCIYVKRTKINQTTLAALTKMTAQTNKQSPRNRADGFTLLEILIVVAIMGILISISVLAFSGPGPDITRAANSISDILQQARTHAMSSNSYVYVGLAHSDDSQPGEVLVSVVEARDGMPSKSNNLVPGSGEPPIQPIRKLTVLKKVQLDTAMADSNLPGNPLTSFPGTQWVQNLEDSAIRFPAGAVTWRSDVTNDQFAAVIQFSPDGAARLNAEEKTIPDYIVFGLVPSIGEPANVVGVKVDGPSGAVQVLRPGPEATN